MGIRWVLVLSVLFTTAWSWGQTPEQKTQEAIARPDALSFVFNATITMIFEAEPDEGFSFGPGEPATRVFQYKMGTFNIRSGELFYQKHDPTKPELRFFPHVNPDKVHHPQILGGGGPLPSEGIEDFKVFVRYEKGSTEERPVSYLFGFSPSPSPSVEIFSFKETAGAFDEKTPQIIQAFALQPSVPDRWAMDRLAFAVFPRLAESIEAAFAWQESMLKTLYPDQGDLEVDYASTVSSPRGFHCQTPWETRIVCSLPLTFRGLTALPESAYKIR